jgi:hypothetical protein
LNCHGREGERQVDQQMSQPNLSDMDKCKPTLNVIDTLNYSASLVERFGKSRLPNGKTLATTLTVDGIPFWDVFSAEFAHSHIPTVLASDASSKSIVHRIRPYLSRWKHVSHDFVFHRHNTHGCATWPTGQTILCLGFTNQMYRDILQPVVARLAVRSDCHVVVLSDQHWLDEKRSSAENCQYHTVWQHWNEQVGKQVDRLRKSIDQIEVNLKGSHALSCIIPDAERHLLTKFNNLFTWFFRVYLPLIIPHAAIARHILENHHPALVLASDTADSRTRVYSVLCRLMRIPCMDVQFGLTGDEGIEWRFLAADCVAVWGDTSKKAMLKQKVPEEKIIITGSPRHDGLVNLTQSEVISKRASLGVPENSVMVVLASTYYLKTHDKYSDPNILRAMQRAVFEAADKTPQIFLIVKPHPVENVRKTQALLGKSPNVIFVERHSDIRELTKVCDAFVSFGSTATIDALIADKLTICPVFPGWVFSDLFKSSGATLVPESSEEVISIFRMIANGSYHNIKAKLETARQEFLAQWVYRADGLAAERVTQLALQKAHIDIGIPR